MPTDGDGCPPETLLSLTTSPRPHRDQREDAYLPETVTEMFLAVACGCTYPGLREARDGRRDARRRDDTSPSAPLRSQATTFPDSQSRKTRATEKDQKSPPPGIASPNPSHWKLSIEISVTCPAARQRADSMLHSRSTKLATCRQTMRTPAHPEHCTAPIPQRSVTHPSIFAAFVC